LSRGSYPVQSFIIRRGWQLVINTGTTIVTCLMVFLIQQSANKDSVALHLKLNELLASHRGASNKLIGIEDASEEELRKSLRPISNSRPKKTTAKTRQTSNAASPMHRKGLRAPKRRRAGVGDLSARSVTRDGL
jgi:low affinity Fe/Cu permease